MDDDGAVRAVIACLILAAIGAASGWGLSGTYGITGFLIGLAAPFAMGAVMIPLGLLDWFPLPVLMFFFGCILLPGYHDYTRRKDIADSVMPYATQVTAAVESHFRRTNSFPARLEDLSLPSPPSSSLVKQVSVSPKDGKVILMLGGQKFEGHSIAFAPSTHIEGKFKWQCASENVEKRLLPQACRD
jgi:pilin